MRARTLKIAAGAAAMLLLLSTAAASAGDFAKIYFNRQTWQAMDWANADLSSFWNDAGWEDFHGTQSESADFLKERDIVAEGINLTASLIYDRGQHSYRTSIASAVKGVDRADCDALFAYAAKQFGKPVTVNQDMYIPVLEDTFFAMTERVMEWTIGTTRISSSCNGTATVKNGRISDEHIMVWTMGFEGVGSAPKTERIPLLCDRTMRFADGRITKFDDQALYIDPARSRALNGNLIPLSKPESFEQSETEFRFTQDAGKEVFVHYVINRLSGALAADVVQKGRAGGQITGTCQKVDKFEKKF